jgi:hypothetical protein
MSLKAKDLRIGNIFDYYDQFVIVQKISNRFTEFGYFKDGTGFQRPFESHDFPKPIELTEDILLKCGFEKKGKRLSKGWFYLWNEDGKIIFALAEMHDEIGQYLTIKYVHQLQNLYFALTGEELQINL